MVLGIVSILYVFCMSLLALARQSADDYSIRGCLYLYVFCMRLLSLARQSAYEYSIGGCLYLYEACMSLLFVGQATSWCIRYYVLSLFYMYYVWAFFLLARQLADASGIRDCFYFVCILYEFTFFVRQSADEYVIMSCLYLQWYPENRQNGYWSIIFMIQYPVVLITGQNGWISNYCFDIRPKFWLDIWIPLYMYSNFDECVIRCINHDIVIGLGSELLVRLFCYINLAYGDSKNPLAGLEPRTF